MSTFSGQLPLDRRLERLVVGERATGQRPAPETAPARCHNKHRQLGGPHLQHDREHLVPGSANDR